MKYQPREFPDLPIYRTVGDILFIGTRHDANKESFGKVKRFLNELSQCRHLLLESDAVTGKAIKANQSVNNYEALALRRFNGQIHFLENDADYMSLGTKYGIRPDLIGFYLMFKDFLTVVRATKSLDNVAAYGLTRIISARKQTGPTLQGIDVDQTVKQFTAIGRQLANRTLTATPSLITIVGEIFPWYFERVRDYEGLCPETLRLTKELEGKKGVITGAGHTQYLANHVSGNAIEQPPQWSAFVDSLETTLRDTVLKIEQKILPEPSEN